MRTLRVSSKHIREFVAWKYPRTDTDRDMRVRHDISAAGWHVMFEGLNRQMFVGYREMETFVNIRNGGFSSTRCPGTANAAE